MVRKFLRFAHRVLDEEIIPLILTSPQFYTMEQHLAHYDGQKREDYARHWQEFSERFGVKMTMECMQKSNELAYNDAPKPRFLFNPSGSLKVVGTYMNAYYLGRLTGEPWLGVGLNTGQLTDRISAVRATIPDSIPVTWDGSNHDGHQFEQLIDGIDGYFFKKTFKHVLPYLSSLPPGLYDSYLRVLVASSTQFYISYKRGGTYTRVVNGKIRGTTFSGHPTRTTLGNSLRVYLYARFVAHRAGVKIGTIVAGDDVLCFISRNDLPRFRKCFWDVYIDGTTVKPKDRCTHGLGQVAKDYKENYDQTFDFLSKYGMIYHENVILNRRIERALLSGNDTNKVNKTFTIAHYNWAITTGLMAWARTWPVVSKYIASRIDLIPHWTPSGWAMKAKRMRQGIREFFGHQFLHHVNHYDYTSVSDAFYLMFNPRAITLMEDDIRFAPHYFDMLYDRAPLKKPLQNESQQQQQQQQPSKSKTQTPPFSKGRSRQCSKAAAAA